MSTQTRKTQPAPTRKVQDDCRHIQQDRQNSVAPEMRSGRKLTRQLKTSLKECSVKFKCVSFSLPIKKWGWGGLPFFPRCGFISCLAVMSHYLAALLIHPSDVTETNFLIRCRILGTLFSSSRFLCWSSWFY